MLHQVEAGLGGVVAQCAIVDTRLRTERAVLLLQMLQITKKERESGNVRLFMFLGIICSTKEVSEALDRTV